MRKKLLPFASLLFLFSAVLILSSCKKEKVTQAIVQPPPPPPPPPPPILPPPPTVDSSLRGHEFIFNETWTLWTDAMGDMIYVTVDPSNSFSIASMAFLQKEVSVQFDTSSTWMNIPQWNWYPDNFSPPANNGYIWYFYHYPYYDNLYFIIENYPYNYQLLGRTVKVKIRFL